jgi:hypothetical protein
VPPVLVANNLAYMNGGRGIHVLKMSSKVYVVNNTLYNNALDLGSDFQEINGVFEGTSQTQWVNNIVSAWTNRRAYALVNGPGATYRSNTWWGGRGLDGISASQREIAQLDPMFVAPPQVDPVAPDQFLRAPDPALIGNGFHLESGSPLRGAGVDSTTLDGLDSVMVTQMRAFAATSLNGVRRPRGAVDIGAYQHRIALPDGAEEA